MLTRTNLVIVALLAAVAVLGVLYYQSRQSDIVIQLPRVEIKP